MRIRYSDTGYPVCLIEVRSDKSEYEILPSNEEFQDRLAASGLVWVKSEEIESVYKAAQARVIAQELNKDPLESDFTPDERKRLRALLKS